VVWDCGYTFQSAIAASLTHQHSAKSLLLLKVYRHYFPVLSDRLYDDWLAKPVGDPDNSILLILGTLRTEDSIRSYVKTFKLACQSNNRDRVRLVFEGNFLDYNQCYGNQSYLTTGRPLYDVVSVGRIGPVEELH
jgi:hypothetical protein